ncbi:hypothetical protein JXR93_01195 [bacterium]|nr:hypothetical protein [bacterium]
MSELSFRKMDSWRFSIDKTNGFPFLAFKSESYRNIFPIFLTAISYEYLLELSEDFYFEKKYLVDILYELNEPKEIEILSKEDGVSFVTIFSNGNRVEMISREALSFVIRYNTPLMVEVSLIDPITVDQRVVLERITKTLWLSEKNELLTNTNYH